MCVVYTVCTERGNGLRFSQLEEYYQNYYPTSVIFTSVALGLHHSLDCQESPPTPEQEDTGTIEELCIQVSFEIINKIVSISNPITGHP